MKGTQVTDIEKKVEYPKLKKGSKLTVEASEVITDNLSDNIEKDSNLDYELAFKIASNMKAESEAIGFYNELLSYNNLSQEDRAQIEEFISDEKNHLDRLSKMIYNYDGNIPMSDD